MKEIDVSIRFVEARKSRGLTQEEVAEKCHLNVRTIQRIESGQVRPRVHTVRIISEALDIDLSRPSETEQKSFIWHFKDLFNFKTHKMRKLTILSSTAMLLFSTIFLIGGNIQAQTKKTQPKSGLTINYNPDNSIERIDAVFTHELTLDSLINISDNLAEHGIKVSYRSMAFDEKGFLTAIDCVVMDAKTQQGGSFSVENLDTSNRNHQFGFYFNYSKDPKDRFCSGACW